MHNEVEVLSNRYNDFSKIVELKRICSAEVSAIDWHELKDFLLAQPKDDETNDGPSWMVLKSNNEEGMHSYEDSRSYLEIANTETTHELGTWLCVTFLDHQWKKQTNNPRVVEYFKNTIEYISQLSGIVHASVHFVSPKFLIVKHNDAANIYSMLLTFSISKNNPEKVTLHMSTGEEFNFKDKEFFTFVPEIEHSSVNLSDSDWIFMMLRIDKNTFTQHENINT